MQAKRLFISIHKWIGLVAAIQVALWMASGLIMSWFPIEQVRGEHNIRPPPVVALEPQLLKPLAGVAAGLRVRDATLQTVAGRPMWLLTGTDGKTMLFDARSGNRADPIAETFAREIARTDFAGRGQIRSAVLTNSPGIEYRGKLPVWQVVFDDAGETHLYVSPETGKVAARRSAVWRLYDFFWMLHIMDYSKRENFNHPAIIGFAALGLFLALSGTVLLWWSLLRPFFARTGARFRGNG